MLRGSGIGTLPAAPALSLSPAWGRPGGPHFLPFTLLVRGHAGHIRAPHLRRPSLRSPGCQPHPFEPSDLGCPTSTSPAPPGAPPSSDPRGLGTARRRLCGADERVPGINSSFRCVRPGRAGYIWELTPGPGPLPGGETGSTYSPGPGGGVGWWCPRAHLLPVLAAALNTHQATLALRQWVLIETLGREMGNQLLDQTGFPELTSHLPSPPPPRP